MRPRILVDRNIPLAEELFGSLGDIMLADGRRIDENWPGLADCDALAIRSVTKVTPALVDAAKKVRFIGTATIGTDHIDLDYIRHENERREVPIHVASAPGSNADSVADHVWFALAWLTRDWERPLSEVSLGIVGHGNCGSRVARRAGGFGMRLLRCDPPLAERDPGFVSVSLDDALAADFVTFHVPLTRPGQSPHPTHHMAGEAELDRMRREAFLINTSRGAVVESNALIAALERRGIAGAVLDVYEGEPEPPEPLIALPLLATPHVAGYAVEAKRRGAIVIYREMCRVFGVEPIETRPLLMRGFEPPEERPVRFDGGGPVALAADRAVRAFLASVYDISATSRELKATLCKPDRGRLFDEMRKNYERDYGRHELSTYTVRLDRSLPPGLREAIAQRLAGFGTRVADSGANYVLCAG